MQYGILTFKELEKDTSRKIIHVDMDAFYASIEVRDQPRLKDKPVIIAKHPKLTNGRGIVSTCNYHARKYGIHSAMSALEAYKRCPKAIFIEGNYQYYQAVSKEIRSIFYRYTNKIERIALDEAYLDISDNLLGIQSATLLAKHLQDKIYKETRLTCSIGVSYNKFIAKLGSDYNKPNGITVIPPDKAESFLRSLPIEKFKGIGEKSLNKFYDVNIYTGEDLYQASFEYLIDNFGKLGYSMYYKVRGISSNLVNNKQVSKSISRERTFSQSILDEGTVISVLEQLSQAVVNKLQNEKQKAYTLTLKIRYNDFETITRQTSLIEATSSNDLVIEGIRSLWYKHGSKDRPIRLLGVTLSNFSKINDIYLDL